MVVDEVAGRAAKDLVAVVFHGDDGCRQLLLQFTRVQRHWFACDDAPVRQTVRHHGEEVRAHRPGAGLVEFEASAHTAHVRQDPVGLDSCIVEVGADGEAHLGFDRQ